MNIRIANIKDYNEVNNLLLKLHQFHVDNDPNTFKPIEIFFTKKEYKERLKKGNVYFLAEIKENTVGIIGLSVSNTDFPKIVFINSLYVEEDFRNNNIATILLEKAIKYFKENYSSNEYSNYLNLNVAEFNYNAIKLYKKIGFEFNSHNMSLKLK